ncbi:NAC domain-containing protein 104-like [Andrographis paniculata]|uniref:NAC domain-containing protein 104-like n=1 Tax=Andrographis paniculata TaxID=175694 RepID=UPI0021E73BD2|nr:NAC domain-containing protein 104-like [Andrographis paniculata]
MALPPGLQFDPTDEELVVYFLCRRERNLPFNPNIIPDLDIYASDPWDLTDEKAYWSGKREWYFFSKIPTRSNDGSSMTKGGFWREVGMDEIVYGSDGNEIGVKKYLVYYYNYDHHQGCSNSSDWMMEEYNLPHNHQGVSEEVWVLCRVHKDEEDDQYDDNNKIGFQESFDCNEDGVELSYLDQIFLTLDNNDDDDDDDQDEVTSLMQIA